MEIPLITTKKVFTLHCQFIELAEPYYPAIYFHCRMDWENIYLTWNFGLN